MSRERITDPLVSVVVATYKRENSLKKAIQSLIEQTYKNIEIIVVDDNADKEWNQKVETLTQSFTDEKRLVYIQNKSNEGSANSRNIGIDSANGVYVTFLDDDDIYLPSKIENQVKSMLEKDADYSLTDLDLYNEDETLSEHRKRTYLIDAEKTDLLKYHLMYHMTGTDTMMFKKDYLKKIDGFASIDVGDEFYLMLRAIKGNGKFDYVPLCDVKAYVHTGDGGLSSGDTKIAGENALYQYKKKYFDSLDHATVRYINMRHHAVLAFAYLRMKNFGLTFKHGALSFLASPHMLIKLLLERKR